MSINCTCPFPSALGDIAESTCPIDLGQIRKIIFRRLTASTPFTPVNITTVAAWDTAKSAVDDDKVVVSPFLAEPIIPSAEAITNGGNDNTTIGGFTEINGSTNPQFTAMFKSISEETIKDLQNIACETQVGTNIGVQFILGQNSPGKIAGKLDDSDTNVLFFPIHSMFVGSINNQGYATRDSVPIQFELEGNSWQEGLSIYTPTDFNALTDL